MYMLRFDVILGHIYHCTMRCGLPKTLIALHFLAPCGQCLVGVDASRQLTTHHNSAGAKWNGMGRFKGLLIQQR